MPFYFLNCTFFIRDRYFLFMVVGSMDLVPMVGQQHIFWSLNSMFSQNMFHLKLGFKCHILKCVLLHIDSACFVSLAGLLQCHNSWSCFSTDEACSCCSDVCESFWKPSFHLWQFCWSLSSGSLSGLFWSGIKLAIRPNNPIKCYVFLVQLLHQLITTPILYDFYNHDADTKEFNLLFAKFAQVSSSELYLWFWSSFFLFLIYLNFLFHFPFSDDLSNLCFMSLINH